MYYPRLHPDFQNHLIAVRLRSARATYMGTANHTRFNDAAPDDDAQ